MSNTHDLGASDRTLTYHDVLAAFGFADAGLEPVLVRWPSEAATREVLRLSGVPRLLLIEPGEPPPDDWGVDEDWIRLPADPDDLEHRLDTLRSRAIGSDGAEPAPVVTVDDDGLVRRGSRWVALPVVELAVARILIDHLGSVVTRDALMAAAWPDGGPGLRAVDGCVKRIRPKLRPLGLVVHGVSGRGYLLEAGGGDVIFL